MEGSEILSSTVMFKYLIISQKYKKCSSPCFYR